LVNLRAHDAPVEIVNEPAPTTRRRAEWTDYEAMAVRKLVMCPDGFIAAIIGREHFGKVALCSLETFSWSVSAHDRWRWYEDLAYCGGRLYAVTAYGDLLAFEVGVDGSTGKPFVSRVERVVVGHSSSVSASLRYLVPSSSGRGGELAPLMVVRWGREGSSSLDKFTVFRADLASSQWVTIDRLGYGEALFVGRLCSRSVRARLRGDDGVRGDQIFFLPDDCVGMSFWEHRSGTGRLHQAAVYDMLDWSVTDLRLPCQRQSHGPTPAAWLFRSSDNDGGE